MKPLGLYLHIPFCKSKCAYCDFYSLPGCTAERMDAYTAALQTHLRSFAARLREQRDAGNSVPGNSVPGNSVPGNGGLGNGVPGNGGLGNSRPDGGGYTVDTVYFGGGTPSLLGERRLLDIWETVVREYPVSADAEVTLEANPDSCGDWIASLRAAGFNRLSLGMQSASDSELREIGRVHTAAQTRAAVDTARRAGFDNLSLDLIYGLPRQTMERWRENVRAAVELGPEHLSCYGLKAEPGTPLYDRRETLPGEEEQADFYLWAAAELDRAGYRQYEISNFARNGSISRHNWKYWTLSPYAGFGPGAHSDFGGARYAWGRDLDSYIRAVEDHGAGDGINGNSFTPDGGRLSLPYAEYTPISRTERAREWVMLGLRTAAGLDRGEYVRRFGGGTGGESGPGGEEVRDSGTGGEKKENRNDIPPFDRFLPFLDQCRRAGYALREGERWRLTSRGFLVSNQIIGRLLELWEG